MHRPYDVLTDVRTSADSGPSPLGSASVECRTERGGEPVAVGLIVAGGVVPVALLAY